jgi:two-component system phosphate regulon response regulator PhoB
MNSGMSPRILLVEDDQGLVELIRYNLAAEGFALTATADGEQALVLAEYEQPDVVILDWMIDSLSGIEVCRRLRRLPATAAVPILMLTARAEETDRIRGLETGADDYMVKPFSPRELVARVRALLRRLRPALASGVLAFGGLEMDTSAHRVARDGRPLQLGPTEFRLLRHFLQNPGRVFSREQLLNAVWGRDTDVEERTVDVHVRRLRRAINADGEPDLIRTVRSAGYSLDTVAI